MLLSTLAGLAAGFYCLKTAKELGLGGICKVARQTITDAGDNVRTQLEHGKAKKTENNSDEVLKQLLNKATPEEKITLHGILTRKEE